MSREWWARIAKDDYSIQFDTDNKDLYLLVEKACQKAVDKADKDKKERKIGFWRKRRNNYEKIYRFIFSIMYFIGI